MGKLLSLLSDLYRYLIKECGYDLLNWIELYSNKQKPHTYFKKQLKLCKKISKSLFPSWKRHLNPTPEQINKYQEKFTVEENV